jgi:hypothetical protein
MTTAYRFLLLLTAMWSTNVTIAGNFDFEIHCFPNRIDQSVKKVSDGGANETKEHWIYDVTIENKTFKELTNLDLKYVIFFTQERLGVKADATKRQQSGNFSIDSLKSHEKKSFSANPVELNKSNLVGHWHYESGAKPNAQDTLVGLAVRVYQGGQQFAEFANPSTLLREKVE